MEKEKKYAEALKRIGEVVKKYRIDPFTAEFLTRDDRDQADRLHYLAHEALKKLVLLQGFMHNEDLEKVEGTELMAVQGALNEIEQFLKLEDDIFFAGEVVGAR